MQNEKKEHAPARFMMEVEKIQIKAYRDEYKQQVLKVWEESVRATHHFLTPSDFTEIKDLVQTIDFKALKLYCLIEDEKVLGFIGVAEDKIEMLFLDPKVFGQGLGKMLLNFAIIELAADKLDVNEQNLKAVKFYQKLGFEVFERTEKDDQGRNYPLLRMKLK